MVTPNRTPKDLKGFVSSIGSSENNSVMKGGLAINNIPKNPTKTQVICILVIFSPKTRKAKSKATAGDIMFKVSASPKGKKTIEIHQVREQKTLLLLLDNKL